MVCYLSYYGWGLCPLPGIWVGLWLFQPVPDAVPHNFQGHALKGHVAYALFVRILNLYVRSELLWGHYAGEAVCKPHAVTLAYSPSWVQPSSYPGQGEPNMRVKQSSSQWILQPQLARHSQLRSHTSWSRETRHPGHALVKCLTPEFVDMRRLWLYVTKFGVVCYAAVVTRTYFLVKGGAKKIWWLSLGSFNLCLNPSSITFSQMYQLTFPFYPCGL